VSLAKIIELQLRDDFLAFGAGVDFVPDRLLERIGDVTQGSHRIGINRGSTGSCFWLASQPNPLLRFAD